jgi:hypothetical protein
MFFRALLVKESSILSAFSLHFDNTPATFV